MGAAIGLLAGGLLTEHLSWRWTLYVNLALAALTIAGTLLVVRPGPRTRGQRVDVTGTILASAGLFAVVFGFSRAQIDGWSAAPTWATLTATAVLLATFGWRQTRAAHRLLPLRILTDRNRAASLLGLLLVDVGIFAVFLFLTYYLQQTLHYTPVQTGLAFLPIIGGTFAGSALALSVLPRFARPKITVPAGMFLAAGNLLWLTVLGAGSSYPAIILPASPSSGSAPA